MNIAELLSRTPVTTTTVGRLSELVRISKSRIGFELTKQELADLMIDLRNILMASNAFIGDTERPLSDQEEVLVESIEMGSWLCQVLGSLHLAGGSTGEAEESL